MTLDQLKQALEEQKMCGAEKDTIELLSRALKLETIVVSRVIYGYLATLNNEVNGNIPWNDYIPEHVQRALRVTAHMGVRRIRLRNAIEQSKTVTLYAKHLLPTGEPRKICNGCPRSLACIANSMMTPEECLETGVVVYPIRFIDTAHVEVECTHPPGKFIVPVAVFPLHLTETP